MLSLLSYLIQIRFRKFVSKGDYLAMLLISGLYIGAAIISYVNYEQIQGLFYFFFIDSVMYHTSRNDIELLRVYKYYRFLIWFEYLFYSLPFLIVLILKGDYIGSLSVLIGYFLLSFIPKKRRAFIIKYPFSLATPFWLISFRKFKLIGVLPIVFLFCVMGYQHNNGGLVVASFVILGIIACLPSCERERDVELKVSYLNAKEYLQQQIKHEVLNTLVLLLPLVVLMCVLVFDWSYVFWACLILGLPIGSTIVKYAFFESELKQQLFIASCFIGFGIPLLSLPFLYNRAIRQLNQVKNVES